MRPLRAGIFLKAVGPVPHPRRTPAAPSARFVSALNINKSSLTTCMCSVIAATTSDTVMTTTTTTTTSAVVATEIAADDCV